MHGGITVLLFYAKSLCHWPLPSLSLSCRVSFQCQPFAFFLIMTSKSSPFAVLLLSALETPLPAPQMGFCCFRSPFVIISGQWPSWPLDQWKLVLRLLRSGHRRQRDCIDFGNDHFASAPHSSSRCYWTETEGRPYWRQVMLCWLLWGKQSLEDFFNLSFFFFSLFLAAFVCWMCTGCVEGSSVYFIALCLIYPLMGCINI